VDASLAALLSSSLSAEATNVKRMATLEGALAEVSQAAAAAQAALADAASRGEALLMGFRVEG